MSTVAYYSTFPSGLSGVVTGALPRQLRDAQVDLILDGLVVYRSGSPLQQVKQIRFFNNTFLLLHLFEGLRPDSLPHMLNAMLKNPGWAEAPAWALKGKRYFRIMASHENQTVAINREALERLESFFAQRLGLRVHRSRPDVEVWFLERSEGYGFAGIRLTQRAATEKDLQKGELRPELANLLCLVSEPAKGDIVLDPFAGSGAIALERAGHFPHRQVIAGDADRETVARLRQKAALLPRKITIRHGDALDLDGVQDGAIDKIITDPPWGIYTGQDAVELEQLYRGMLAEFERVLKPGGLAVVLMGRKDLFEQALRDRAALILVEKYDILVSGKKAAIYKLKKG